MSNGQIVSKYEKVRIISARALQIAQGAPPLVKVPKNVISPVDIATLEFDQGVVPIEARKREL
ncbi:MAG TPA: DNA-directed RNA polymerase subunit K [archaeon]|nr:DNA-directed RNA polymerase subunit K [archaeon]